MLERLCERFLTFECEIKLCNLRSIEHRMLNKPIKGL
jgi:hypothetical protein